MFRASSKRLQSILKSRLRWLRRRIRSALFDRIRRFRKYRSLGSRGERAAARYLIRNGYCIWDQNVRTKFGEIDIIAAKERILVFLEVKTRSEQVAELFSGREAVDDEKERRIEMLAHRYMRNKRALMKLRRVRRYRFDVIEVTTRGRFGAFHIRQFRAAF